MEIQNLLSDPFPFGKYKKKQATVATAILDTNYLKWLDKNVISWPSCSLMNNLVKYKILLSDRCTVRANKRNLVCAIAKGELLTTQEVKMETETKDKAETECIFCFDGLPSQGIRYAFAPCGHAVVCGNCATSQLTQIKSLERCPICRTFLSRYDQVVKIYL